jgi:hypothetical protein
MESDFFDGVADFMEDLAMIAFLGGFIATFVGFVFGLAGDLADIVGGIFA